MLEMTHQAFKKNFPYSNSNNSKGSNGDFDDKEGIINNKLI